MYYLRSLLIFPYEIDSTSYIEINNQHIFGIYHILIVDSEFFTMWSQLNLMKCIIYLPSLPYRADTKYIYITRFRNISNLFSNFPLSVSQCNLSKITTWPFSYQISLQHLYLISALEPTGADVSEPRADKVADLKKVMR